VEPARPAGSRARTPPTARKRSSAEATTRDPKITKDAG
jgi:hypothetical protein